MKAFARLSWVGSGLGLILLTASPSFADVTGTLEIGGTGSVIVTESSIQFPVDSLNNTSTSSSAAVANGTTLTYDSGSTLTVNQPIDIESTTGSAILASSSTPLSGGAYSVSVPLIFPSTPSLTATITQFGPGSTNTSCATATGAGDTCSPSLGGGLVSPIILENEGNGSTVATLPISGTISDNGGTSVSSFTGNFTATLAGETPEQAATIGTYSGAYAGSLTVSEVPEPRAVSFVLFAGLLMGAMIWKRRKATA